MYKDVVTFCPDVLVEYHTATYPSSEPKSMLIFLVEFCLSADVYIFVTDVAGQYLSKQCLPNES